MQKIIKLFESTSNDNRDKKGNDENLTEAIRIGAYANNVVIDFSRLTGGIVLSTHDAKLIADALLKCARDIENE